MKRSLIGVAGFFYGILLACVYITIAAHNNWSPVDLFPGCYADDCNLATRLLLVLHVLAPALIFFILNFMAWNRWTLNKWLWWLVGLTALLFFYWLCGYIWKRF